MEKILILNIAGNVSLLEENYKNYVEIKNNNDFDSHLKKKNLYNNWIIALCNMYNSLLKYYKNDTNEYWEKIKVHVSQKYTYEGNEILLIQLIRKYRNKTVHSENSNSIENNLLPYKVDDIELEKLQTMMIDLINYELKKIDENQIVTYILKNGINTINYKKMINFISEGMKNATAEEKEMLMIPCSILENIFNILIDDSLLSEEIFNKIEKDLDYVSNIINNNKLKKIILEQPNGKDILDFLEEIKNANNERDFYNSCMALKNKILSAK